MLVSLRAIPRTCQVSRMSSRGESKEKWKAVPRPPASGVRCQSLRVECEVRRVFAGKVAMKKCQKVRFKANMLLKTNKVDLVESQKDSGSWLVASGERQKWERSRNVI